MLWSDEQPLKAPSPIVVTLFGILMLFSEEQPLKAHFSIVVTPSGIVIWVMLLLLTPIIVLLSSLNLRILSIAILYIAFCKYSFLILRIDYSYK